MTQQNITQFEIEKDGRDVWEIEITGGELAEDEDALDYTYYDLVDEYWPASIAAVQYHTNEITTQYVGHSNGCRVALSSLNSYQETGKVDVSIVENLQTGNTETVDLQASSSTPVVDTFVGVACPVVLNDNSQSSDKARAMGTDYIPKGDIAINNIRARGLNHIYRQDYSKYLALYGGVLSSDKKISTNLMDFYNDLGINLYSFLLIDGNLFNKAILFAGTEGYLGLGMGGDGVVPLNDMKLLNNTLDNSSLYLIKENHGKIINNNELKLIIRGELNG